MAIDVYKTSDGKEFDERDYGGWVNAKNAAEQHQAELDRAGSSSYTPSSSGGSSGFNYAGDENDFGKINIRACFLIEEGKYDEAIAIAKKLITSFSWEPLLVEGAKQTLERAEYRKAEAIANPAKALFDQGFFAFNQKKDNAKAVELWKKAADLGSEEALEFLSRSLSGLA